ncbi:MAG TPA: amino acid racemase [Pyrinomonadaceae bacterium]|nr:amino acid racemase [Pyrinomonadaceae bacterium]
MKTVGIVGGIAPESTIEYYRQIIAEYRKHSSVGNYPSIIINSINLTRMIELITANQLATVTEYLLTALDRLARAGVDFAVLASNTPHIVFDEVRARSPLPLISIVEAACAEAETLGLKRVGLFGTRFTMQATFYSDVFSRAAIKLVVPSETEQDYIHTHYMDELINGIFLQETKQRLLQIVDQLKERSQVDGIILGGTELPLILREAEHNGVPFLDTTKIHVNRIVAELVAYPAFS